MTLDQICQMTTKPSVLNALHACREGHPWNKPGINHWRNAWVLAVQRPSYEISRAATDWLNSKAADWDRVNGFIVGQGPTA